MIDNLNEVMPPTTGEVKTPLNGARNILIPAFVAAVGLGIAVAIGIFAGYFIYVNNVDKAPAPATVKDDGAPSIPNEVAIATSTLGVKGQVSWQTMEKLPDLGLWDPKKVQQEMGNPPDTANYYKVGTFIEGKYKGGDLILFNPTCVKDVCIGTNHLLYLIVKNGDSAFLLKQRSGGLWSGDGFVKDKISVDEDYIIGELDFPQTIIGPQPRMVFELDTSVRQLFDGSKYKKIFDHQDLGGVYVDKDLVVFPLTNGEMPSNMTRNGFYIRALDGTLRAYALKPDFLTKDYPNITWNNQSGTGGAYSYIDYGGCGAGNYASVMSPKDFSIDGNLVDTGVTNKRDKIYEIKDRNHALLRYIYDVKYQVYKDGDQKISYDEFVNDHPVFFWVDPFGRLIKFHDSRFVPAAECGKPVIYLYPEKPMDVTVKVAPAGGFTYTDPVYNEATGWIVHSDKNSNLIEKSTGKKYPYLFWEGRGGIYDQPKDGFVIKQSEVHSFLIEKLAKLGLNKKETTDFMEFWEPRMQSSPYYFVSFLGTSAMNQIAPLDISPTPDTIIRILMDFSPLDQPITVREPRLSAPARTGFTVIEWGGVIR